MVLGQSVGIVAVGPAIGLAVAFAGTRAIANLIVGIKPTDPATFLTDRCTVCDRLDCVLDSRTSRDAGQPSDGVALRIAECVVAGLGAPACRRSDGPGQGKGEQRDNRERQNKDDHDSSRGIGRHAGNQRALFVFRRLEGL